MRWMADFGGFGLVVCDFRVCVCFCLTSLCSMFCVIGCFGWCSLLVGWWYCYVGLVIAGGWCFFWGTAVCAG